MNAQRRAITSVLAHRLGHVGEQLGHLGRGLEPVLDREPTPVLLRHLRTLGDADQRVVRVVAGGLQEVHVVGRDQRQSSA